MRSSRRTRRGVVVLAVAAVSIVATGCATLSQEDLDAGLESLRGELTQAIQEGDAANAQATADLESRMNARISAAEQRLEQFSRDVGGMERAFGARVERLETSMRFNVPVYFGFDEAVVTEDSQEILDTFREVADEHYPDAQITVEGFTDPAGPPEYNQWLGQQRAEAVKAYLVEGGMSGERVKAISYGEVENRQANLGARGPGVDGWENRRVVLVIDHDGEPPAAVTTEDVVGVATRLFSSIGS